MEMAEAGGTWGVMVSVRPGLAGILRSWQEPAVPAERAGPGARAAALRDPVVPRARGSDVRMEPAVATPRQMEEAVVLVIPGKMERLARVAGFCAEFPD